jgi:hypothetical protein
LNITDLTSLDWWLRWTACVITLAGATATSLGADPLNIYLLNVGCAIYVVWSIRIREWSLVTINLGLMGIYVTGTLIRLLG